MHITFLCASVCVYVCLWHFECMFACVWVHAWVLASIMLHVDRAFYGFVFISFIAVVWLRIASYDLSNFGKKIIKEDNCFIDSRKEIPQAFYSFSGNLSHTKTRQSPPAFPATSQYENETVISSFSFSEEIAPQWHQMPPFSVSNQGQIFQRKSPSIILPSPPSPTL